MTPLREAAQQALEALEKGVSFKLGWVPDCEDAIIALKAALAEPVQEPVAYMESLADNECADAYADGWNDCVKAHKGTAPPQRKPLTGHELKMIELRLRIYYDNDKYDLSLHDFARAIERAHGIGGNDA